jgi:hypothetical protein
LIKQEPVAFRYGQPSYSEQALRLYRKDNTLAPIMQSKTVSYELMPDILIRRLRWLVQTILKLAINSRQEEPQSIELRRGSFLGKRLNELR